MNGFSQNFIADLKLKVTLSDFVKSAVTFDKKKSVPARQDWWSPCPFHYEKSASFHVDDRKGFYHCFGCGVHGSVIDWLIEYQKMSFIEALTHLCQVTNTPIPAFSKNNQAHSQKKKSLYDLMQHAQSYFEDLLYQDKNHHAFSYMHHKRGLSKDQIKHYGIGYASQQNDGLYLFLKEQGYSAQECSDAGLIIIPDNGRSPYDRFRDRIMFPVKNQQGHIVTYGGRALNADAKAKYLNGSETEIFKKSAIVYNIDKITHQRTENAPLIVSEGYMDVIALGCHGFKNCVAPMGTALTDTQIKILWRYHNEPILCFDGDKAGLKAACRAAHKVLEILIAGYSLRFCFLPDGLDPDDYLRKLGTNEFQNLLDNAVSLSSVLFAEAVEKSPPTTPERRAGLEKELFEITKNITDDRLRQLYQSEFFTLLNQFIKGQKAVKKQNLTKNWGSWHKEKGYNKTYDQESLGVKNFKNFHQSGESDSFYDDDYKILGLFIRFAHYLMTEDFELLAKISFELPEKQTIQRAILNIFLKNKHKILENIQDTDNIPFGQFDVDKEKIWQLPLNIRQSDTYRRALLASNSIDPIKMSSTLQFINQLDRIKYYRNILHFELCRMHNKLLQDKKSKDFYQKASPYDAHEKDIENFQAFNKQIMKQ